MSDGHFVVTGGSGFCGSHFVEYAARVEPDRHIVIFDIERPEFRMPKNVEYFHGDVRYSELLDQVIPGAHAVYDFAGYLGTSELFRMKTLAVDVNVKGAINVLEACLRYGVPFVYHPTKNCFYAEYENMYTITKITAERLCQMFKEVYGMSILIMRFLNVTGPRQHLYPIRKFIPLAAVLALTDRNIEVYGDGQQTMDVVDVRDVARLIYEATFVLGRDQDIVEVGYGHKETVDQVAHDIIECVRMKYNKGWVSGVVHVKMRPGEKKNEKLVADIGNLTQKMPAFEFKYDYRRCIEDSVDYYAELVERSPDEVAHALEHFQMRSN